jgi:hypothetical protein
MEPVLAIGAPNNDERPDLHSGHVRIYQYSGIDWIHPQRHDGEYWEIRVVVKSLSSDGTWLLTGRHQRADGAEIMRTMPASIM